MTVTVEVADAVQELTVNAGTAGQFADAPVAGAIASALLLFCGAPVAIAGLLLVVAGTVAVAYGSLSVLDYTMRGRGSTYSSGARRRSRRRSTRCNAIAAIELIETISSGERRPG